MISCLLIGQENCYTSTDCSQLGTCCPLWIPLSYHYHKTVQKTDTISLPKTQSDFPPAGKTASLAATMGTSLPGGPTCRHTN